MQAKDIRPGIHSIKGKNVALVRNWRLLTEVVFADGTRVSYFPTHNVKVHPARDSEGKFVARNYIIAMTVNGRDVVNTFTGRSVARRYLKLMRSVYDPKATMVAL